MIYKSLIVIFSLLIALMCYVWCLAFLLIYIEPQLSLTFFVLGGLFHILGKRLSQKWIPERKEEEELVT